MRPGRHGNAEEAIRDLVEVTRKYDLTHSRAVGTPIGLGAGLTPSGDDFLVGYLAGLWCAVQSSSERVRFVSDLGEEVVRLSAHTSATSCTCLSHATHGQMLSLLVTPAGTICHGEAADHVVDAAEAAMRVGHTSGMVAVAGLLLGFAVWNGDHLLEESSMVGPRSSALKASL